ncbi:hypothetical protein [Geothrix campi]|uniref:hypothetical protein n=1 Tax=Geothrix campi TaxID=2966450 RepID=UPI002147BED6|nr:hypothetical protein [Geothrix sp. SG10]
MFKPELIEAQARGLETTATQYVIVAVTLGIIAGVPIFILLQKLTDFALVAALVPVFIGALIGDAKGRALRLQAQQIRLQLQIEANTRHLATILELLSNR